MTLYNSWHEHAVLWWDVIWFSIIVVFLLCNRTSSQACCAFSTKHIGFACEFRFLKMCIYLMVTVSSQYCVLFTVKLVGCVIFFSELFSVACILDVVVQYRLFITGFMFLYSWFYANIFELPNICSKPKMSVFYWAVECKCSS